MKLKSYLLFPVFFVMGVALVQCSTSNKTDQSKASKNIPISNLTRSEAEIRSGLISKPHYQLSFNFDALSTSYTAQLTLSFTAKESASTFLDFKNGEILSYSINGASKPVVFENNRIILAKEDVKSGENQVQISIKQSFSKNGRGIYRFQDSEDSKVYIWSKLEPFDANQIFPCFDQPDIKGTFASDITVPSHWKVVFSTLESSKTEDGQKTKWIFPSSPLMSSYLFSIHAGDYVVWNDTYKDIPLRLFARASLKKYVDPSLWFSITKKGFGFFEKEFAYPYPFKKYDQLVVPEFSSGGMENVAAVNYHERHIYRSIPSREEKEALAAILLHEMAHMWFGDLVTNKWWDELWLNESFATFMSYRAMTKATEFKDSGMSFQRRGKLTAYIEDQYVTSHPVSTEVPDINSTFNHFDAITYSKGASVLNQLFHFLGEANFRKGIQRYFKDYAYTNTTLPQFIGALEKASDIDLRTWSVAWLRNSGIDSLKVTPECTNGTLTLLKLDLIPPTASARPRPHRLPIALYLAQGDKVAELHIEDWKTNGDSEVRKITKKIACPDFVLPNVTDVTYIKTVLTPAQIRWAQDHLHKIKSAQARGVFWNQAYLNLRDGTVKIDDFIKLFLAQYKNEKNTVIVQQFFTYWSAIANYLPQKSDIQLTVRTKILETLEETFWKQISESNDSLWKKTLLNMWIPRVETSASLNRLYDIITSKISLKSFTPDQDARWAILKRLSTLGHAKTDELLAFEKEKDPSENGFKSYLAAQAAKPSLLEKTKWLEEMNRPDTNWSLARKQSIMTHLFPATPRQTQLRDEFSGQFYKTMSLLDKRNEDISYNRTYAELAPISCDETKIQEFDAFIGNQDWNVVTKKVMLIQNQENKICARVRSR